MFNTVLASFIYISTIVVKLLKIVAKANKTVVKESVVNTKSQIIHMTVSRLTS